MRQVVRNSFARETVYAERVTASAGACVECGQRRYTRSGKGWLYRFLVQSDGGRSGYAANGNVFCSRSCAETYIGQSFDETR